MAYNVSPSGDKKRLSFGPGNLFVNGSAITPDQTALTGDDIGFCRGSSINITRQKLDVFQGSPRSLIETYAIQEDVTVNFTGLEWDPQKLVLALGSGDTADSTGSKDVLAFGGEITFTEVSLLFRHITPTGGTLEARVWKAQGLGEFPINFGDDLQEFAYNFRALESLKDWSLASLAANRRLVRLEFTRAP